MKLNKKGYMLVEIVISFTLAMGIAYYLLNLTYKFKNTDEDIYRSTLFLKDKTAITKNIMNDLDRGSISNIQKDSEENTRSISFNLNINPQVIEERKISIDDKTITYGKINEEGNFETSDVSYYTKTIDESLIIKDIEMSTSLSGAYFSVIIKISSLYDNNDYDLKLFGQVENAN